MLKLKRIYILTCCIVFSVFNVLAQQAWTLQQCVEYALKNNITVKQNQLSVEQARTTLLQSKLQMAPTLNANGSHSYNFGRSVDPFSYTFTTEQIQSDNVSLNSSLTIFNGFQLQNTLKQSKLDFLASQHDLEKIRNDISLNVVSSFLQVLYVQEQLMAAQNRSDQSKQQRDRTKLLADAGSLTQGHLLDAEAQLAADELGVITAQNQLDIATLSLTQLLELKSATDFKVQSPDAALPELSVLEQTPTQIFQLALQSLPEIKSSLVKVESAERGLAIARAGRSPRISASGSISTGYSSAAQSASGKPVFEGFLPNGSFTNQGDTVLEPFFSTTFKKTPFNDQFEQNYNRSVGLSISIPLFNGWSTNASIKRAKLNLMGAQYAADIQRNTVFKSIQQAYADAVAAQKKFAATRKSVDALQASFSYTDKKFQAGVLNSLDFMTARNNLTKAQSDLLQAKYDFVFRVKVLDFYAGKPLVL